MIGMLGRLCDPPCIEFCWVRRHAALVGMMDSPAGMHLFLLQFCASVRLCYSRLWFPRYISRTYNLCFYPCFCRYCRLTRLTGTKNLGKSLFLLDFGLLDRFWFVLFHPLPSKPFHDKTLTGHIVGCSSAPMCLAALPLGMQSELRVCPPSVTGVT